MSANPFMQLYVGDYLADTLDLTTEQHGAYLLVLMTMWRHGARLPNDPAKLARIARVSPRRWHLIWNEIGHFFFVDGDQIGNSRLEREHKKAVSISQKRSSAGSKGGTAKSLKNKPAPVANATDLPKHGQKSDIIKEVTLEETSSSKGASAPVQDNDPKALERRVYEVGKTVLGKSAGGVITKLRKTCAYDDQYALDWIEQAREKQNPMEWLQAVIRASQPEMRAYDGVDGMPRRTVPVVESKEEREWRIREAEIYRGVL